MADEQHRATALGDFRHLAEALALKFRVAHGEDLIDHKNLRLQVRGNCKREAHVHAAGIAFHRCIEKFFGFGKDDDFIELLFNFSAAHSENRAI